MNPATERHAVVTGGGSGIGAAIALCLAQSGMRVSVLGRRAEALARVVSQHPNRMQAVTADLGEAQHITRAFAQLRERFGPPCILVNNAGQVETAPFLRSDNGLWERMLAINLTATLRCTQAALPDMLHEGWGRIINVASTAGLKGYAYVSAYCAAKHGVIGLTRALALEVAHKGITVNAVCPGYTETDLLRSSLDLVMSKTGQSEQAALDHFTMSNPQARLVQPQEVADTVRWLCGEEARSIHGQSIAICGGEIMN